MRYRQRTDILPVCSVIDRFYEANEAEFNLGNNVLNYTHDSEYSSSPQTRPTRVQKMEDELGTWPLFGECRNCNVFNFQCPSVGADDLITTQFLSSNGFAASTTACSPSFYGLCEEAAVALRLAHIPEFTLEQWATFPWVLQGNKAFTKGIKPSLTENLSLVNFVIELRDLLTLARSIKKLSFRLKQVKRISGNLTAQQVLSAAAGGFLAHVFGVAPLVRDLVNLVDLLVKFKEKAVEFDTLSGKVVYRHSSEWAEVAFPNLGSQGFNIQREGVSLPTVITYRWVSDPAYYATIAYTYQVPAIGAMNTQIRQFLSLLGVNLDPSIVWNAIPYSFLVDWFVGVGDYLHSLRVDTYDADVVVHDYCHSVRGELVAELHVHGYTLNGSGGVIPTIATREAMRVGAYQRTRFKPGSMKTLIKRRGDLTAMQWGIGSALAALQFDKSPSRIRW